MRLRAVKADASYVLRSWYRSRASFIMTLVIPLILLLTLGLMFNAGGDARAHVRVQDLDATPESARLVEALRMQGSLVASVGSAPVGEGLPGWMDAQKVLAVVAIPAGFGQDVAAGRNATVTLSVADTAGVQGDVVRSAVESSLARFNARAADPPSAALVIRQVAVQGPIPYSSFLLPGLIGLNILSTGLSNSFMAVVQLRHQGLLGRLAVSPMTKGEWLLGRMIGQAAIAFAGTLVLVAVAVLAFHAHVAITPAGVLLVIAGTLVFSGIGTALGGLIRQPEAAAILMNIVSFPIILLSGTFFDTAVLPGFLRWLPAVSPLKYLNDGLRADMLFGDARTAWLSVAELAAIALVVVVGGARLVRWTHPE